MRRRFAFSAALMLYVLFLIASYIYLLGAPRSIYPKDFQFPYSWDIWNFWEGNPSEVWSHWLHVLACSGCFAGLMLLLFVERRVRLNKVCFTGSWTLKLGTIFTAPSWLFGSALGGEIPLAGTLLIYTIPIFILTIPGLHILACGIRSLYWDIVYTLLAILGMIISQVVFERSGSGAPNDSIFVFMLLFLFFISLPVGVKLWVIRIELQRKGYDSYTWKEVLFVALNKVPIRVLPNMEELRMIPGFCEGNLIISLRTIYSKLDLEAADSS